MFSVLYSNTADLCLHLNQPYNFQMCQKTYLMFDNTGHSEGSDSLRIPSSPKIDLNVVQPKIVGKFPEARCAQN